MASINKVLLIGYLGQDPKTAVLPSGATVANVSLATSESWKDKTTGEKQERTEWHRVTFYGALADIVAQYLRKGALVYVEGRLQTRKWQGQDGQDRYTTEIIANEMKMLGGKRDAGEPPSEDVAPAPASRPARPAPSPAPAGAAPPFDDDIPF